MRAKLLVATVTCALLSIAPPGVATHGDPTHGVAPHTVLDDPTKIHVQNISTPHPYPSSQTFEWNIHVEEASSLSIHFERYDVRGFEFLGECSGSEVTVRNGDTGEVLETFCGTPRGAGNDFWTQSYAADNLTLELDTGTVFGEPYGFDIYEVASDGAQPVASVPYSDDIRVSVSPSVNANPDPFQPEKSTAALFLSGSASVGDDEARKSTGVQAGEFFICSGFTCERVKGYRVRDRTSASVGGTSASTNVDILLIEDDSEPTGYRLVVAEFSCRIDGEEHCSA